MLIYIHENKTSEQYLMKKAITITDNKRILYIKNKLAKISEEYNERLVQRYDEMKDRQDAYKTYLSGRDDAYENCDEGIIQNWEKGLHGHRQSYKKAKKQYNITYALI